MVKIMITGVSDVDELGEYVLEIEAVGLPVSNSPDSLSPERARTVAQSLPVSCRSVLVTHTGIKEVLDLARAVEPDMVQIDNPDIKAEDVAHIKKCFPRMGIIKVFPIGVGEEDQSVVQHSIELGIPFLNLVDIFSFDTWNARYKLTYGAGRKHHWPTSRTLADAYRGIYPIPIMLGGGLTQENLQMAIETVHPDWVDVSSGVKVEGRVDLARLAGFIRSAKQVTP